MYIFVYIDIHIVAYEIIDLKFSIYTISFYLLSLSRNMLTFNFIYFSELWNDELQSRKKRKDPFSPDKKKPVVVSDIFSQFFWLSL